MIRGIYTATASMIAGQRKLDILTGNLANIDTPGYKSDRTVMKSFPDILQTVIRDRQKIGTFEIPGKSPFIGTLSQGVYLQETIPDFTAGDLVQTGQPLDIAISDGAYFFTVQDNEGNVKYTRNGSFQINDAGQLVTADGYPLLDATGQPVTVYNNEFRVSETGLITKSDGTVQQIGLALVQNPLNLVKEGNNIYRSEGEQPQLTAEPPAVLVQGYVERSNVDAASTMMEMMSVGRLYEANQRVIRAIDETLQKAVNDVGAVK